MHHLDMEDTLPNNPIPPDPLHELAAWQRSGDREARLRANGEVYHVHLTEYVPDGPDHSVHMWGDDLGDVVMDALLAIDRSTNN